MRAGNGNGNGRRSSFIRMAMVGMLFIASLVIMIAANQVSAMMMKDSADSTYRVTFSGCPIKAVFKADIYRPSATRLNMAVYDREKMSDYLDRVGGSFAAGDVVSVDALLFVKAESYGDYCGTWNALPSYPAPICDGDKYAKWIDDNPNMMYPPVPIEKPPFPAYQE